MDLRKVWKLLRERRAVSTIVSNIILVGTIIAVGFAVLGWTYSTSNSYAAQYGSSVLHDINKLSERIAFEYIFYNSTALRLSVYIINCGNIGTVTITTGYINNASWTSSSFVISLHFLNESTGPARVLGIGQEGYFIWPSITLQSGNSYAVKIVTGRGSSFASTFTA
jgi:hypothetical protein